MGCTEATLDCVDGYHGVALAEEDQQKTTFITEKGRFCYRGVPQGFGSLNDGNTIQTYEILATARGKPEVNDYKKILDDIIQWSGDLKTSFFRICSRKSAHIWCNDGWRLVLPRGGCTIPAEMRYSPTKGEALAVAIQFVVCSYRT